MIQGYVIIGTGHVSRNRRTNNLASYWGHCHPLTTGWGRAVTIQMTTCAPIKKAQGFQKIQVGRPVKDKARV